MFEKLKKLRDFEGLQFYRCMVCHGVISEWDIREKGGCPKCRNTKIVPSHIGLFEQIKQFLKHPKFWNWPEMS